MFTKEVQKALQADGEKLRQLTDQEHGPKFCDSLAGFTQWEPSEKRACECGSFNVEQAICAPNGVRATMFQCECGAQWTEPEMVF